MSTKIAIFADIHGNLPALEAVLVDIEEQAPDEVLVGGDLVGRGPQGSAVVGEIRRRGWETIRGNHEEYLLGFRNEDVPPDWLHLEEWAAARWMAAELSEDDVEYLSALPFSVRSQTMSELLLTHGSPKGTSDGLGPWTRSGKLDRLLDEIEGSVLVCGHTHRPMVRELDRGMVVNVGSVGLPFNGDRRAQYAMLDNGGGKCRVELRQVEYDLEATLEVYRSGGFLEAGGVTAQLLRLELLHATPYLVPFQRWAEAIGVPPEPSRLEEFLDFYEPDEPLRDFFMRIQGLFEKPS
ncbi:MAG: metallophosphoesterase family protein [bacterium]|nr:metallophosphoesterase family protein [bacterium]